MNSEDVFINCPFSDDYDSFFKAILFTVIRSGFNPRCAREEDDGGDVRFDKICRIIEDCKYGIHDISKTDSDGDPPLPRFNMPLELGLFLGARKYGDAEQSLKKAIIFDREAYRYQKYISDISGQDIHAHNNDVDPLIIEVAAWLRRASKRKTVPGGTAIADEYAVFMKNLPVMLAARQMQPQDLTYDDDVTFIAEWLVRNA
ncbi:hypothetical protein [Asticcacaulis benevestitus]|uniref:Uncharacterized protein n=1 Tax=Asticcacaulis benevestitus DSM 16100 = ATCC BAA-896 TaxID=1121022 RepID=V4RTP1_9CAUL|nr:hypothetical protein [Asticcacaulis benevestitus]ESQ94533.1 hypothetical protein ABENE_00130 [Asticcacaulis benevestitus DSM 16100 = ATCC BAA-896]